MKDLKQFTIQYIGLKETSHLFEYQIDNTFFEAFNFDEFYDANIKVVLNLEKKSTLLNLHFTATGTIKVQCDVSGEEFDQEINAALPLLVNFGEEFNDDNEELLILPYTEFQINVAQYIYEMIVLSTPSKRVHPKVLDGTMESEALKKLEELRVKKEKTTDNVDPRWDKLKNIITEKKT
ncbi:DNA-binding protein [Polaribacter pacificus]|uniref:DNA-binding protein n=1 Tax=Polaribacter pacificus TaxID=1775173 RepID=A0A917MEW3_9FLAO|nr:DUF177 domain-containing protein [Polaribacter pacificus]GGG94597.1 DNA-binding protein [Polaribacter pacificus]